MIGTQIALWSVQGERVYWGHKWIWGVEMLCGLEQQKLKGEEETSLIIENEEVKTVDQLAIHSCIEEEDIEEFFSDMTDSDIEMLTNGSNR